MEPFTSSFCALMATRAISDIFNKISEYVFPYEQSKDWKRIEHSQRNAVELETIRQRFQKEQSEKNATLQIGLAEFNRRTSMMLAEYNTYRNLKNSLLVDAIRNFPLNISPLILLENNHIDVNFLLNDSKNTQEETTEYVLESSNNTKPLSVFITPIHIDSRVNGREAIAAQVFDSVYSSTESIFVNEYSRNGIRPVIFYPTAWNKNVKGGLHASEELYYFLKDLPTLVIEPRFDGTKLKIMFSCWGLGYSVHTHFRQEMVIDMDWNTILVPHIYERSKKALSSLSAVNSKNRVIVEQLNMYKHNVEIFEKLHLQEHLNRRIKEIKEKGSSSILDELGDYSKFFYSNTVDLQELSQTISSALGMTIAAISDSHHLLASDVCPRLPQIYGKYFGRFLSIDVKTNLINMYEQVYRKLMYEFPESKGNITLDYMKAISPLSASINQENNIIFALTSFAQIDSIYDIDSLFEQLKNCIEKDNPNHINFLNKLYEIVNQSSLERKKKLLGLIDNAIQMII